MDYDEHLDHERWQEDAEETGLNADQRFLMSIERLEYTLSELRKRQPKSEFRTGCGLSQAANEELKASLMRGRSPRIQAPDPSED